MRKRVFKIWRETALVFYVFVHICVLLGIMHFGSNERIIFLHIKRTHKCAITVYFRVRLSFDRILIQIYWYESIANDRKKINENYNCVMSYSIHLSIQPRKRFEKKKINCATNQNSKREKHNKKTGSIVQIYRK